MNRLIIIGAGGHGRVVADASSVPAVFLDEDTSLEGVVGTPSEPVKRFYKRGRYCRSHRK